MPTAAPTKPGTQKLSEVTKHLVQPSGIVSTGWPAVRHTCRTKLGVGFDRWQDGVGHVTLAKRADGKLASTIGGVGWSFPRQVGKTYLLQAMIFGLSINQPGLLTIWTSHHQKTSGETFLALQAFAKRYRARPYVERVYTGSGDEEVRFHNGSRILFGAREHGFGIGIPAVDILVNDEAQILSEMAMENLLATMNTSQFGLHLYVGTPPKPTDRSEAFTQMRLEALSGESDDLAWIECGAGDDADPEDMAQVAKANPSYPHRTPIESIHRMRRKLTRDGFLRQGMGIWNPGARVVFDLAKWATPPLLNRSIEAPSRSVMVIDVSPDRRWSSIGIAGDVEGKTLVMCHRLPGTEQLAQTVAGLVAARDILEVAITPDQAKLIKPGLIKAGVDFKTLTRGDMGASCAALQEAVKAHALVHVGQGELDAAVANARTRYVGEVEMWDRRDPGVDISPLVACSAAFYQWGLQDAPLPAIY